MRTPRTLLIFTFFLWSSCEQEKAAPAAEVVLVYPENARELLMVRRYDAKLSQLGKMREAPVFSDLYRPVSLDSFDLPLIDGRLLHALQHQQQLLRQTRPRKNYRIGNLAFDTDQLAVTVDILRARQHTKPFDLSRMLEAYQIWGADRRGNVRFTGYFTPIIPVRAEANAEYRYPIYDRPRDWIGELPTRAEIVAGGALDSLQLEIAYARDRVDIYYMQLQGSGFAEYPDGRQVLFSYNGTNRHPYRSIEKYLLSRDDWPVRSVSIPGIKAFLQQHPELRDSVLFHNPSYTFFKARFEEPQGAGNVPLTGGISIAVDRHYLPLGSCLLAAIPIYDAEVNRVIGHEYRFLLAQDTGGKIKGPGHVDFYFGVGKEARQAAMRMNQYGRLWLLLPRRDSAPFPMNVRTGAD